jgi:hypothetical protein
LQQQAAQLAQKEQYVSQVLPLAQQALQHKLPQAPDPKLATEDPIEHYQQMVRYTQEMGQFQQLQQAEQARLALAQRDESSRMQQHLARQKEQLVEEYLPELKKPERLKEFTQDFQKFGTEVYKYRPEELNNVTDARLMVVVNDAIQWRKHLAKQAAQKPVVQAKVAQAVPVAAPAKREAPKAADQGKADELIQRAMKTGRPGDAAAALALFD